VLLTGTISSDSRLRLRGGLSIHLHRFQCETHLKLSGNPRTMLSPMTGVDLKPMIDVDGLDSGQSLLVREHYKRVE
jgi:hypothetical protein